MESTPILFSSLPKRDRNAALKRIGLLDALLVRLSSRPLPDITVRELCDDVGIAEQTFFNTFGGKSALLTFYVMLWSIEMQWRLEQAETAEQGLRMVFNESAAQIVRARFLMPEIVVHQLRGNAEGLPTCAPPTLGDKLLRLDDMPGASAFEALPIQTLIGRSVRSAIADNELSSDTDSELFTWVLCSLFFGSTAASPDPNVVARVLVRGFDRLWMAHSSSTGLNR